MKKSSAYFACSFPYFIGLVLVPFFFCFGIYLELGLVSESGRAGVNLATGEQDAGVVTLGAIGILDPEPVALVPDAVTLLVKVADAEVVHLLGAGPRDKRVGAGVDGDDALVILLELDAVLLDHCVIDHCGLGNGCSGGGLGSLGGCALGGGNLLGLLGHGLAGLLGLDVARGLASHRALGNRGIVGD